jgi:hypothetical protein
MKTKTPTSLWDAASSVGRPSGWSTLTAPAIEAQANATQ